MHTFLQVFGKVPTISIDKTDGCQMYLSTASLTVELITSKSSEMNVMVPNAKGDYVCKPYINLHIIYAHVLLSRLHKCLIFTDRISSAGAV